MVVIVFRATEIVHTDINTWIDESHQFQQKLCFIYLQEGSVMNCLGAVYLGTVYWYNFLFVHLCRRRGNRETNLTSKLNFLKVM